ncbi:MAG TPA: acyl carrier protein [Longimicrobium sp.]|nr:acyl carrier protein [Longimicrobium sp.]
MREPMDPARIETELREMLREWVRHPERPIALADHLIYDLEIEDDDAELSMIPDIQGHFGIEPPASAWGGVATVGDVVGLVVRYQRQPPTPAERARDVLEQREAARGLVVFGSRFLAAVGVAAGLELAGSAGAELFVAALGIYFAAGVPARWREGRRFRRERAAWKARRAVQG